MEFTTEENKAKVVINPAELQDAFALKSAIEKAFLDKNINIEETMAQGNVVRLFMALDSSQEVFDLIFKCLSKSTYNGVRITPEVFEKEESRVDLYDVFFWCLKVNVYPFFKRLLSQLGIDLQSLTQEEDLK